MKAFQSLLARPSILMGLLLISSLLLLIGVCTPIMTIKTLVFMRHSFSILSGIYDLLREGKYLLFLMLGLFSVVLPAVKLGFLYALLFGQIKNSKRTKFYLKLIHDYGRWAMLDVMVVAVLIVTVKLGAMASVEVHYGLYVFSAAVLLTMITTHLVINNSFVRETTAKRN